MDWTKNLRRTPTWPLIVIQLLFGLMWLVLAVLNATRFAAQVTTHGDGLMTVAMAAVGGLAIGSGLGMIRQRAALRHILGIDPATAA